AGVSGSHGLVYEGRELVAESGSTEAFRMASDDAGVEVVTECGADRGGEGLRGSFVDEQAGLLGHDALDGTAPAKGNHPRAASLRLERDGPKISFPRHT